MDFGHRTFTRAQCVNGMDSKSMFDGATVQLHPPASIKA